MTTEEDIRSSKTCIWSYSLKYSGITEFRHSLGKDFVLLTAFPNRLNLLTTRKVIVQNATQSCRAQQHSSRPHLSS